jgi:Ca2+-binding EF-hand superfamily protein
MLNKIFYDIAKELTKSKVPIRDTFEQFDRENTGYVFRNEFSGNILENYLRL